MRRQAAHAQLRHVRSAPNFQAHTTRNLPIVITDAHGRHVISPHHVLDGNSVIAAAWLERAVAVPRNARGPCAALQLPTKPVSALQDSPDDDGEKDIRPTRTRTRPPISNRHWVPTHQKEGSRSDLTGHCLRPRVRASTARSSGFVHMGSQPLQIVRREFEPIQCPLRGIIRASSWRSGNELPHCGVVSCRDVSEESEAVHGSYTNDGRPEQAVPQTPHSLLACY